MYIFCSTKYKQQRNSNTNNNDNNEITVTQEIEISRFWELMVNTNPPRPLILYTKQTKDQGTWEGGDESELWV